ncbi:hypothetical protein [Lysinibacillus sp. NPDC092081]|uniref:hypothetical protein n=1 Tax=Lysinibacillus sp. NPDC092081 TaxID=3364131 RepID=UPI00381BB449
MFKKTTFSLLAFLLLLSPVSNALANSSKSQTITDKEAFEATLDKEYKQSVDIKGETYDLYQYKQTDGSIKIEAHSPNGGVEIFRFEENVLYDEKGEVLATNKEEKVPLDAELKSLNESSTNSDIVVYAYDNTEKSPYPSADYNKYIDTYYGNLQLEKNIKNFTAGALAVIVGIVAPAVGVVISSILIANAWENNIDAWAIFYKKVEWHHKGLGSLAKQFYVTMYWDPKYTSQASPTKVYYSIYY